MQLSFFYHGHDENSRSVEDLFKTTQENVQGAAELYDIDGREGSYQAELHDVMSYPCILMLDNDGRELYRWPAPELPTAPELSGYFNARI